MMNIDVGDLVDVIKGRAVFVFSPGWDNINNPSVSTRAARQQRSRRSPGLFGVEIIPTNHGIGIVHSIRDYIPGRADTGMNICSSDSIDLSLRESIPTMYGEALVYWSALQKSHWIRFEDLYIVKKRIMETEE